MSGMLWLITEDENDYQIIQQILRVKKIAVRIRKLNPDGGSGGISRLLDQLETLIRFALSKKSESDCIAILHDADENNQPNRKTYNEIRRICKEYNVYHVTAADELEAWLLADSGLCKWLGIKHESWDTQKTPSKELDRLLKKKHPRMKYQGRYRKEVLKHLDGNILSPSLQKALNHLKDAPCTR